VTITVIRSGTVITGDGRTSLPDTDVVLVDGVVRDLPYTRIRIDRSGRQTSSSTRPENS
jgi:hypothetical protein